MQATLDNRTATVGFNPAVPGGIAPLGVPGTRPPTTEDIQAFVERLGFRRDRPGAVSDGALDDPNNLVDFPTGFDAWDLGLELHQDFVWQRPGLAQRLAC